MEFHIDKHSAIPVAKQIEEQIKLAVMLGIFRDGDTLPSIRDIEKQTGINRSQIHKAYLQLRKSGLLVLTRGKGSVITTATDYPKSVTENCRKLSETVLSKVRRLGISPTAFARFLSQQALETERDEPFIIFTDSSKELAARQASDISKLWRVPVSAMEYEEVQTIPDKNADRHKILVNHVMHDYVYSLLKGNKTPVIPIEVHNSPETIRKLSKIKPNSSVKLLVLPHPSHRVNSMIAQVLKLINSPEIKITPVQIPNTKALIKQLQNTKYDYCILGPALRGDIPAELRGDPKIIPLIPELDPASLEIARIRAGVII